MLSGIRENGSTNGIDKRDRQDFAKAINLLNRVIARVQEYAPDACYYMECETMHLMTGEPHDDGVGIGEMSTRQDRCALDATIDFGDCGAW